MNIGQKRLFCKEPEKAAHIELFHKVKNKRVIKDVAQRQCATEKEDLRGTQKRKNEL